MTGFPFAGAGSLARRSSGVTRIRAARRAAPRGAALPGYADKKPARSRYLVVVAGVSDELPVVALPSDFLTMAGFGFAGLVAEVVAVEVVEAVAAAWAFWTSAGEAAGASAAKAAPDSARAEIATVANNRFMMDPRGSRLTASTAACLVKKMCAPPRRHHLSFGHDVDLIRSAPPQPVAAGDATRDNAGCSATKDRRR